MRTLHVGLRVGDLDRSLAFYTALGYEVVGAVPETPIGHLTMLRLPGDDFVSVELVHDPSHGVEIGTGLSHLVVQVDALRAFVTDLARRGIEAEPPSSPDDQQDDFLVSFVTDPDGNKIELVQWPSGHAIGMTAADFE